MDDLRAECGDAEFGYRLQALFAHVLLRLGARVLEINAQGHPDVRVRLSDREMLVQVKTCSHTSAATIFEMTEEDVTGITEAGRRAGVLAFLDCAEPVSWSIVPADRAAAMVGRLVHVATLRADSDHALSEDCTEEFLAMIQTIGHRLRNLTYTLLRDRALAGELL
jgi:hypothetical protein